MKASLRNQIISEDTHSRHANLIEISVIRYVMFVFGMSRFHLNFAESTYVTQENVQFAAWNRKHSTKAYIFRN